MDESQDIVPVNTAIVPVPKTPFLNLGLGNGVCVSAYLRSNRLCILGIAEGGKGPIPFAYSCAIEGEILDNGAVALDTDTFSPGLEQALTKSQKAVTTMISAETMRRNIEHIVQRARLGDQNAMALIIETSKAAKQGNSRAKHAYKMFKSYIRSNPVKETTFGEELLIERQNQTVASTLAQSLKEADPPMFVSAIKTFVPNLTIHGLTKAYVMLANGPTLSDSSPLFQALTESYSDEREAKAYRFGLDNSRSLCHVMQVGQQLTEEEGKALQVGYTVGLARRIQAVRQDDIPISVLSEAAGWELGE